MKIPSDPNDRELFFAHVLEQCFRSRESRLGQYGPQASYYMFGTGTGDTAAYNKVQATVDLLTSFIYSAESTRFNIHVSQDINKREIAKIPALVAELYDTWHSHDIDLLMESVVQWALVYNSMIVKVWYDKTIRVRAVDPSNFGVYQEELSDLDDQPAVGLRYFIEYYTLEENLKHHPNRDYILEHINMSSRDTDGSFENSSSINRVISNTQRPFSSPNIVGGFSQMATGGSTTNTYDYTAAVNESMVELQELFIWDDEEDEYHIVTMASPNIIIYDRKNFYLPGKLPFAKVCPYPLNFYFWGRSFTSQLNPLQDWRTERLGQVKTLLGMQVNPPRVFTGFSGIMNEKAAALNKVGGFIDSSDPTTKVETLAPKLPNDIFAEIAQIDAMFDDTAGITSVMRGRGEQGVRAKGHADTLARLSSSRTRSVALRVEDAVDKVATLIMRNIQTFSTKEFTTGELLEDKSPFMFIPSQFTSDYMVKVDAHSSSPIFSEDKKADAITLMKAHAIDRETFLELMDPPGLQLLKEKLKKIEEGEQKSKEEEKAFALKEDAIKHAK